MSRIIRTPTSARGGITAAERSAMEEYANMWIARAMRTDPIEPEMIIPAIEALYAAAGLKKPRVVIVPSPLVMAFAYGAAAAIWHERSATDGATDIATDSVARGATDIATYIATDSVARAADRATSIAADRATHIATHIATATASAARSAVRIAAESAASIATYIATDSVARATDSVARAADRATRNAADRATHIATHIATATASAAASAARSAAYSAADSATRIAAESAESGAAAACYVIAGQLGLACAARWSSVYQGGNMWAARAAYIGAFRDVLGLRLPEHAKYAAWEQAAIHGGFRVLHPEFCIVSDFPEFIHVDEELLPHCETGPSHRWRDGWALYHWHGTRVPAEWIENRHTIDPAEIIRHENVEVRAVGAEIIGWPRMLSALACKVIDHDPDPAHGDLIELTLPGLAEPGRFLRAECPRNGTIVEGVPRINELDNSPINTVRAAQAWRVYETEDTFDWPGKRT
jgi:hypothetical protein